MTEEQDVGEKENLENEERNKKNLFFSRDCKKKKVNGAENRKRKRYEKK